jgi:aspartyl protease family protein
MNFGYWVGVTVVLGVGYAAMNGPFDTAPAPPGSFPPPPVVTSPPPYGRGRAPAVLTARADASGQFWIKGSANGMPVLFLVDTGASDITFSKRSARMIGIDATRLTFDGTSSTANGLARTATTRMARLAVGPFVLTDVSVTILDGDLNYPLLGMGFLRRMNVAIGDGKLTMRGPL